MMPFKTLFLPLVILTFLSLSPLSHTSMAEDSPQALLQTWKGKLHNTSETIIENEGSPATCVSLVKKMAETLSIEWKPILTHRNTLLEKLDLPVSDTPLFDFNQWSEEFLADTPSGVKQGVMGALRPLETLVLQITGLEDALQCRMQFLGTLAPSKSSANRAQVDSLPRKEASKKNLSTADDRHSEAVAQAVTTPNSAQKNEDDLPAIVLSHD